MMRICGGAKQRGIGLRVRARQRADSCNNIPFPSIVRWYGDRKVVSPERSIVSPYPPRDHLVEIDAARSCSAQSFLERVTIQVKNHLGRVLKPILNEFWELTDHNNILPPLAEHKPKELDAIHSGPIEVLSDEALLHAGKCLWRKRVET
jgi:hypothetical protein